MSRSFENVGESHADFLRDESRRFGAAVSISFPTSESEAAQDIAAARALGRKVTVQGARTGITAGAVPDGGHILNLGRLNKVLGMAPDLSGDEWLLRVQPGVILSDLRKAISTGCFDTGDWTPESVQALERFREGPEHFFPPDPTETSASIGGMAACNASGAQSLMYGPMRPHVVAARLILSDGSILDIARGRERCRGRAFQARTISGRIIAGSLPCYEMPRVKNAAGYYSKDDMDLLDLFIGSDGTLGVFSELTVRLIPAPPARWGIMAFLPAEDGVAALVARAKSAHCRPAAMEFFDGHALDLLRRQKEACPEFAGIPELPAAARAALYVEYHGTDELAVEAAAGSFAELLADFGTSDDNTWLASDRRELQRLKDLRHAIPEAVNLLIDERRKTEPALTKLGTDLAVPDAALGEMLRMYHRDLGVAGLDFVVFGHIGDNHLHVNILPRTLDDYRRGRELYLAWARTAVALGGTVAAEHGIGKLKKEMLKVMYGEAGIAEMRRVRALFDPDGMLGSGNLF